MTSVVIEFALPCRLAIVGSVTSILKPCSAIFVDSTPYVSPGSLLMVKLLRLYDKTDPRTSSSACFPWLVNWSSRLRPLSIVTSSATSSSFMFRNLTTYRKNGNSRRMQEECKVYARRMQEDCKKNANSISNCTVDTDAMLDIGELLNISPECLHQASKCNWKV